MYSVDIVYLPHYNRAWGDIAYAKPGDSGFDLRAAIPHEIVILPGEFQAVPCGVKIALPKHTFPKVNIELQVRSRSGLAVKNGIFVLNSPGTVDNEYRGEIKVVLANISCNPFQVNPGDRIAQGVVTLCHEVAFREVKELAATTRGETGFGSTGVAA